MKILKTLKLATEADLSEASFEQACDDLVYTLSDSKIRDQLYPSHIHYPTPNTDFILEVPFFAVDDGLQIMARFRNCDLKVRRDMGTYEWRVIMAPTFSEYAIDLVSEGD